MLLAEELRKAANILEAPTVPSEEEVKESLHICENLARSLVGPIELPNSQGDSDKSSTSSQPSLQKRSEASTNSSPPQTPLLPSIRNDAIDQISSTAYNIIADSKVFITPGLLATYVYIQYVLGRPQSFPKVFDFYASKPVPRPGTSPIKYRNPNPDRASSAIPVALAHTALNAAIQAKDIALCLSIIDTSVGSSSYRRNKFYRRALLPFSVLALTPAAAYVLASRLAPYQHGMDTQMATNLGFLGITAYIGFTAAIGIVAITTANDQMDRITWATGTALRERWLREDERALVDIVAGAWGFRDLNRRGEEVGWEWEALREWAGRRKMELDRPELMEGME